MSIIKVISSLAIPLKSVPTNNQPDPATSEINFLLVEAEHKNVQRKAIVSEVCGLKWRWKNYKAAICFWGEAAAEWSVCGHDNPKVLCVSSTARCWQLSTIAEWLKTTHILPRSSINTNFSDFIQEEQQGQQWPSKSHVSWQPLWIKFACANNGLGLSNRPLKRAYHHYGQQLNKIGISMQERARNLATDESWPFRAAKICQKKQRGFMNIYNMNFGSVMHCYTLLHTVIHLFLISCSRRVLKPTLVHWWSEAELILVTLNIITHLPQPSTFTQQQSFNGIHN